MPDTRKVELFPVRLLGYRVCASYISAQIQSPTTRPDAVDLLNQIQQVENRSKGIKAHLVVKIEDADTNTMTRFAAELASVSSKRSNVSLLLHIPKSRPVAMALFDLVEEKDLFMTMFPTWRTEEQDGEGREKTAEEIQHMLNILSDLTSTDKEEILYRLTTFSNKEGQTVEGKRNIEDISERQMEVVRGKLRKSLSSVETDTLNFEKMEVAL